MGTAGAARDDRRERRDGRERRRRRGERSRSDKSSHSHQRRRIELESRIFLTPVVKVLLFGLLLSLLDVLYSIKQLEDLDNRSQKSTWIVVGVSRERAHQSPSQPQSQPLRQSLKQSPSDHRGKDEVEESDKDEERGDEDEDSDEDESDEDEDESDEDDDENKDKDNNHDNDYDYDKDQVKKLLAEREPIIQLITSAGISFDPVEDIDLIKELPKWSDVVEMYGPKPVIYGLDEGNCERFQAQTDKGDHFIATAGTFNSGTNLMSEYLVKNCVMPERMKKHGPRSRGIRWQVPWGKHSPAGNKEYREKHKTSKDKDVDAEEVMPMVTIRDPLVWLKSMCRHKYTASWTGFTNPDHCPDFARRELKVRVKYADFVREYESLIYLWNNYYQDYKNIDIPFLLVRFEDLVFHPEETTRQVCECAGGEMYQKQFKYVVDSAKKGLTAHGKVTERTGYVDAMVRYGTLAKRYEKWDFGEDLDYVKKHVDPTIMKMMGYAAIDPSRAKDNSIESDDVAGEGETGDQPADDD